MKSNIVLRLATTIALLFAGTASAFQFYCPRADLTLASLSPGRPDSRRTILLVGDPGSPRKFPRTTAELNRGPNDVSFVGMQMNDCSDRDFLCRDVDLSYAQSEPVQKFSLVVPRVIAPGKEYSFHGVRMVSRLASRAVSEGDWIVQLTLWQVIGGVESPMEITIQRDRGMIYLDGMRFDPRATDSRELCVLQSQAGIFESVKIERH